MHIGKEAQEGVLPGEPERQFLDILRTRWRIEDVGEALGEVHVEHDGHGLEEGGISVNRFGWHCMTRKNLARSKLRGRFVLRRTPSPPYHPPS